MHCALFESSISQDFRPNPLVPIIGLKNIGDMTVRRRFFCSSLPWHGLLLLRSMYKINGTSWLDPHLISKLDILLSNNSFGDEMTDQNSLPSYRYLSLIRKVTGMSNLKSIRIADNTNWPYACFSGYTYQFLFKTLKCLPQKAKIMFDKNQWSTHIPPPPGGDPFQKRSWCLCTYV